MTSPMKHEDAGADLLEGCISGIRLQQSVSTFFEMYFRMNRMNEILELNDAHVSDFLHHGTECRRLSHQTLSLTP